MAAAAAAKVHLRCICGAFKVHLQCIGRGEAGTFGSNASGRSDPHRTGKGGRVTHRRGAAGNPPAVCTNLLARQKP